MKKNEMVELEDKVFPLIKDVVASNKVFDEKIEETRRQMLRFDEVISDKASKYDMVSIQKKLMLCMEKVEFDAEIDKQNKVNDWLERQINKHSGDLMETGEHISTNKLNIEELMQDVI